MLGDDDDTHYYRRRSREELAVASSATDDRAREIHTLLSQHYAARAEQSRGEVVWERR